MGADADYTIEKKLFWIHPHAKTFFHMCFKNEYLDITIWTTALKQSTTRVLEKLVSETFKINLCLCGLLKIVNHKRDIRSLTIQRKLYTLNH